MITASRLFAERGFEAVSLRDITRKAGANVAAVSYHFGSKEELISAVFEDHVSPVNRQRLSNLTELEKTGELGEGKRSYARSLLDAFFRPLMEQVSGSQLARGLFAKLMARMVSERGDQLPEPVMVGFTEVANRYVPAFCRACPQRSEEEILWRIHYSFGVFAHTFLHGEILKQIAGKRVKERGMEEEFCDLIEFCAQGFEKGGSCP